MAPFASPGARTAQAVPAKPFQIGKRIQNEFYPTPPEATRALLSVEEFDAQIWEPACGDGGIAKVLANHGQAVVSTDLYAYGFGTTGIDFLKERSPRAKHIVTNPPYGSGLADAFVKHALMLTRQTGGKVAMLLNMASLCHASRTAWWKENPPARIYSIDDIFCWPDHVPRPNKTFFTQRYCWVVWSQDHQGPSTFWWLASSAFRGRRADFNICASRRFA